MQTNKQIIEQFLTTLANEVKQKAIAADMVATGKTIESIEVVMADDGGKIIAAKYIGVLEDGRRPTRSGAPKGNPTLRENIEAWITARNITPKDNMKVKTLAFLIARKIHREGNALYRAGGKSGILSTTFTQARIDAFAEVFSEKYQSVISSEVLIQYKK